VIRNTAKALPVTPYYCDNIVKRDQGMRPEEIDYSNRHKHYIDIANGEILAGREELSEYKTYSDDPSTIFEIGPLLKRPTQEIHALGLDRLDVSEWTQDSYIEFGKWIKSIVPPPTEEERYRLNRDVFINAANLGVGPGKNPLYRNFGSYSKFYIEIQAGNTHGIGNFNEWTLEDFLDFIKEVGGERRPTLDQISERARRNPSKPKAEYMHQRFKDIGGFSRLVELAGYPVVDLWERDDYIDWGVKFMQANSGLLPTAIMANYTSKKKLGPSGRGIIDKFDKYGNFQREVLQRYQEVEHAKAMDLQEKLAEIEADLRTRKVPEQLFMTAPKEFAELEVSPDSNKSSVAELQEMIETDELIARYAKYKVLKFLNANFTERACIGFAIEIDKERNFISAANSHHAISQGEAESAALYLGLFDYLWPLNEHMQQPKLDSGYEEYYKRIQGVKTLKGPHKIVSKVAA
jgi:hypothetical protein